jgi:DNA-binding Lrp family transcriptional regulator
MESEDTRFDDTDMQILARLQRCSSAPIHELANQLGISIASCSRRIKRLEAAGVIERYVAILNPAAMGIDMDIFVSVRLNNQTRKTKDAFHKMVTEMPEVVECYSLTGDSDFMLHVRVAGVKEFAVWMQDRLLTVTTLFRTQSQVSLERLKYTTELPLNMAVVEKGQPTTPKGANLARRSRSG